MPTLNFESQPFQSVSEQEALVKTWQAKYYAVVGFLGQMGSGVRTITTMERDDVVRPHSFVRQASHEFVFPPQRSWLIEDKSGVSDENPGMGLRHEDKVYSYDESLVQARITVSYEDAYGHVKFSATTEGSARPWTDAAQLLLDETFAVGPVPAN